MAWTGPRNLPALEAIKYQGKSLVDLTDLWSALQDTYNLASERETDPSLLEELPSREARPWLEFSMAELRDVLEPTSNCSAPGLDHLTWKHVKMILSDVTSGHVILEIANACFRTGHWPSHFKKSCLVIIPKLGKPDYATPNRF